MQAGKLLPTSQPTVLNSPWRSFPRLQEFALSGPRFIAVFLRIQIKRCLNLAMTQEALNGFGLDFRLVHLQVAKRVTKIVTVYHAHLSGMGRL